MIHDVVSNDGVADRLWLFSYGEMKDAVYPSAGFNSDIYNDAKRSGESWWWLRSPYDYYSSGDDAYIEYNYGAESHYSVAGNNTVAPGFTLSAAGTR